MEIEALKKTQTAGILEMENLDKQTETTDISGTNKMQERRENFRHWRHNQINKGISQRKY